MFRAPAFRIALIILVVFFAVGQKGGKREGKAKQGAKLDDTAVMTGLADQFRRGTMEGKDLKTIQMDAAEGDCSAQCIVAAHQIAAGAWVGLIEDIGYAVIEGTIQSACQPVTAAGNAAKTTTLKAIKKAKEANDPVMHGTLDVPIGDALRKFGGDASASCNVTYTVSYDSSTSTVTALFICNCGGQSCSFTISYPVNESGQASGPATVTRL